MGKAFKLTSIVLILLILFVLIPTSTMPVVPVSYLEFTLEAVYLFIPYHYVANFLGVAFQPDCLRVEIEAISGRNYRVIVQTLKKLRCDFLEYLMLWLELTE